MARNGSGTYNLPAGNPVTTGTTISSTWANGTLSDMATALTGSIAADGQTTASGNLPMGGFIHTNVGNATVRTNYASAAQVQDGSLTYLTSVSGADTITAVGAVGMTAYAAGQQFTFVSAGANTGAATLNINSIGAKAITKNGTTALSAGDIASGAVAEVVYDGTQFQLISAIPISSLSLPVSVANGGTGLTSAGTSGNVLTSNGTAWVSSAPSVGKVLQVINVVLSGNVTTSSSTFSDTGLTATITPTSATSKVLVMLNVNGVSKYTGNTSCALRLLRNSTVIPTNAFEGIAGATATTDYNAVAGSSLVYQDSPATTSATTYKVQFASTANIALATINDGSGGSFPSCSTITLMEISA